jgi:hypothetical protein
VRINFYAMEAQRIGLGVIFVPEPNRAGVGVRCPFTGIEDWLLGYARPW